MCTRVYNDGLHRPCIQHDAVSVIEMTGNMKAMIALVLVSALVSGGIAVSDSSDADEGFTVTDSTGKTFTYSAASEHIIVTGYAATLTIIESGMAEKIYAVDQYGAVAFDDKGLERPANVWTTTYNDTSALKSNIVHAGENGFDIATDTVILTTYKTDFVGSDGNSGLRAELMKEGFRYVPFYGSIVDYNAIVSCVRDIENITGSTSNLTASMMSAYDEVTAAAASEEKKDAIFLRYSSSKGWGIGVSGSIAVALLEAAGGNNIGSSAGKDTVYNQMKIVELLSDHPDALIFIDSPYFDTYEGTFDKFIDEVMGGDQGNHGIVKMLKTWNNYDPAAADGLKAVAHVMHPDAVDGTLEAYYADKGDGDSSVMLYVGIGAAAIIAAVGVLLFIRSRN